MSSQKKTAKFINDMKGGTGVMKLYKMDPPHDGHEYVAVSATNAMFSGPETYIFGADDSGEIVDWGELEGSFKGGLDHERALSEAGYEIA